jgi:membrane fusion protein (multidrug efflux system)
MKRRYIFLGVGVVALVAAGVWGFDWWTRGRFIVATDNAYVRADITLVSARIEGQVQAVHVGDNQTVAAGAPLVDIDPADSEAALARAQADLARARSDVARAVADAGRAQADAASRGAQVLAAREQVALQQRLVEQARAGVQSAEAGRAVAAADAGRFSELARRGYLSPARLDQAEAQDIAARAGVNQAQAALGAAREQVAVLAAGARKSEADHAAAQASAAAASAAAGSARAQLEAAEAMARSAGIIRARAAIVAPVSGVVANRTVRQGQLVRPGTQLLAIVPLDRAYVVANFKETQIARLKPGQPVALKLDAAPDAELTGRIESIAPASGSSFSLLPTDTATGNFTKITQRIPVRIAISEESRAAGLLRPGLSIVVEADTRSAE